MTEVDRQHRLDSWEALNAQKRFQVKYPHDRVVSWTFRNFDIQRASEFRLLDLGCGAGRHTLFWLREGYRAAALDLTRSGVTETIARSQREGYSIEAMVSSVDSIPFPLESMDGIVCHGVFPYLSEAEIDAAISEIHRVLKPGGKALIVTRSFDDDRCKHATKIAGNTYRINSFGAGAPSDTEAGMLMTFLNREGIERLGRRFSSLAIDFVHFSDGGGAFVNADWYIQLGR
jgi:SAM-dependent methyltransferase